jgi:Fe2+ transport system protein FeoA
MSVAIRYNDRRAIRPESTTDRPAALSSVSPGHYVCAGIDDSAMSPARMKSLGVCVGRPLELVSSGDPMIIRVCGSSVGISRQLAAAVSVVPETPAAEPITADI